MWAVAEYPPHHSRAKHRHPARQTHCDHHCVLFQLVDLNVGNPLVPTKNFTMATATEEYIITPAPFPARSKSAFSTIKSMETIATSMSFADKILITITQQGRLAHWVCSD